MWAGAGYSAPSPTPPSALGRVPLAVADVFVMRIYLRRCPILLVSVSPEK